VKGPAGGGCSTKGKHTIRAIHAHKNNLDLTVDGREETRTAIATLPVSPGGSGVGNGAGAEGIADFGSA
jgi:uncharacterized Rossmann fold enzyme